MYSDLFLLADRKALHEVVDKAARMGLNVDAKSTAEGDLSRIKVWGETQEPLTPHFEEMDVIIESEQTSA